jgi:F-type H+-transporting ATPase subunit a
MELQLFIAGRWIIISNTIVNTVIITILLSIFAVITSKKAKKAKAEETPSGFMNLIEIMIESVNKLVIGNMGENNLSFAPFMLTMIIFIAVSNFTGLLMIISPTSDYSVTLTLALIVVFVVQITRYKTGGGVVGYLKFFLKPHPAMLPLNLISEIVNPISMSFRLFGNILSGTMIMIMIYDATAYFAPLIAPALHLYFDIFSGALQAFIFTMLTMVYISNATQKN